LDCCKGGIDMAAGLDAVRTEIVHEFGSVDIRDRYDAHTNDPVLDFSVEGRYFTVRVTREFDKDYTSGQVRVNLAQLGPRLRASRDGKATVTRNGILN